VGDIRNEQRVDALFQKYRFDSVFHAAAYKHVPMMEAHPVEAVETNVLGTWNLVRAARQYARSSFLMISSDKAVNPANLMGLTKRVAELLLSSMNNRAETDGIKFVSVRFGNVLGSNGSVIPVFQQQIAAGGPVTVTHPEVRRYFMTIQEGVQLVLQASTMAQRSEIFVLDMGESIRIIDLARNMIRLSGLEPGKDIEILYTGLRPGEKLNEQLMIESENVRPTYHEKIKVFHGEPADGEFMEEWIRQLKPLISERNDLGIVAHMAELVPEYQPGGHWAGIRESVVPRANGWHQVDDATPSRKLPGSARPDESWKWQGENTVGSSAPLPQRTRHAGDVE
jgi:FlaA1/EpsC-like NDP-sugar epimerase